jgi:predicted DNA-binding antitoxin AbrB/MazE fold protein
MMRQINAVYEGGVLRPLEPLDLAENEQVVITVAHNGPDDSIDREYLDDLRKRLEGAPAAPGLEEVRRMMSKIPGSLSDEIIASRGTR